MEESCSRICMEPFPKDRFIDVIRDVVKSNIDFVPPYGTGGSLYIRPILFGNDFFPPLLKKKNNFNYIQ